MAKKYYFDTCIWIDFIEDRVGSKGEPFGRYASELIRKIKNDKNILFLSNMNLKELVYNRQNVLNAFENIERIGLLKKVRIAKRDMLEARAVSLIYSLDIKDAIHAVIAKNNDLILVSRDRHFYKIKGFVRGHKPEELI